MNRSRIGTVLLFVSACFISASANAEIVHFDYQCWSEGNNFRVNSEPSGNYLASTRFFLDIQGDGDTRTLRSLLGHVSGQKYVDGAPTITQVDFYSQVNAKDIESSLSPRARVYKDSDYWRFNGIVESVSSSQDGGSLSGTLIISKKYDSAATGAGRTFEGHFVFQHGDHTGGTMDLTCQD